MDRDSNAATVDSIGSVGPGIILDFRNDQFNPTKGTYHTFDLEYAHPIFFSNTSFVQAQLRNSAYVPLAFPFSFTIFGAVAYAKSLSPGATLPTARLVNDLSLGGQGSIRGFAVRVFSPDVFQPQQTAFYNVRFELTTYLFSNLSAAVFLDSGQIFPDLRSQTRHYGEGNGLRNKTPVGPIVIDVARGLGPDGGTVRFYFTVGTL